MWRRGLSGWSNRWSAFPEPSAAHHPPAPPLKSPFHPEDRRYRGRIAPSPTGLLHLGHARTFLGAAARAGGGELLLRIEDIDPLRCRPEFSEAILRDLAWLGLTWQGDPCYQSKRWPAYREALQILAGRGLVYPCPHSRREIAAAATRTERDGSQPLFPPSLRPDRVSTRRWPGDGSETINWRFRVPDGRAIMFADGLLGPRTFTAGTDFGDFLVWRKDGWPSYEMAVVVDDIAQAITEVVRGADLVCSTARQQLLYEALEAPPPAFAHLPLVVDSGGRRLSKTAASVALRTLRERRIDPALIRRWAELPAESSGAVSLPPDWR